MPEGEAEATARMIEFDCMVLPHCPSEDTLATPSAGDISIDFQQIDRSARAADSASPSAADSASPSAAARRSDPSPIKAVCSISSFVSSVSKADMSETHSDRVSSLSQTNPAVLGLLSFDEQPTLLRGSRLSTVLRRHAQTYASSRGSRETYDLSEQVHRIHSFISHNWSLPRYQKYIALVFHFNQLPAALINSAVMVAVVMMTIAGALPVVYVPWSIHPRGVACRILCTPIFLITLCWYWDVCHAMGNRGLHVFLDKACIHQVDKDIQRQGILKLGAFLRHSSSMVVLYTDIYLRKLWTVYEVACFLVLKPIPLDACRADHVADGLDDRHVVAVLGRSADYLARGVLGFLVVLGGLVHLLKLLIAIRSWARDVQAIEAHLNFSCDATICACEEDRPLVYSNIAALMKAVQQVDMDATEREALTAFERLVMETLPSALQSSIGCTGVRYLHSLTFSTVALSGYFLDIIAGVGCVYSIRMVLATGLDCLCWVFGFVPFMFALWMLMARRYLHLTALWGHAYLIALWLVGLFLIGTASYGITSLVQISTEHDWGLLALALATCARIALNALVYQGACSPCCKS